MCGFTSEVVRKIGKDPDSKFAGELQLYNALWVSYSATSSPYRPHHDIDNGECREIAITKYPKNQIGEFLLTIQTAINCFLSRGPDTDTKQL